MVLIGTRRRADRRRAAVRRCVGEKRAHCISVPSFLYSLLLYPHVCPSADGLLAVRHLPTVPFFFLVKITIRPGLQHRPLTARLPQGTVVSVETTVVVLEHCRWR